MLVPVCYLSDHPGAGSRGQPFSGVDGTVNEDAGLSRTSSADLQYKV